MPSFKVLRHPSRLLPYGQFTANLFKVVEGLGAMFDRFDFFEKLYFHELDRRHSSLGLISVPVGLIGLAAGTAGYLATRFKFGGSGYWLSGAIEVAFALSLFLTIAFLAVACWHTGCILVGPGYRHLSNAQSLLDYHTRLTAWHRSNRARDPLAEADKDFADSAVRQFAADATWNWHNNNVQSGRLWRANAFIAAGGTMLVIALLCYYIDFVLDPPTK
jgi:hypothetical protein